MGMTEMINAPMRRRKLTKLRVALIGSVIVLLGFVFWVAWVVTAGFESVGPRTLSDTLSGKTVTTVKENTAELCAEIDCIEGWETGVGNYLRFETNDWAGYWSIVIGGDSFRNGNIILDMNGLDLSMAERQLAVDFLFPGKDWT